MLFAMTNTVMDRHDLRVDGGEPPDLADWASAPAMTGLKGTGVAFKHATWPANVFYASKRPPTSAKTVAAT